MSQTKRNSQRQEHAIAEAMNGIVQPGSGNQDTKPGDVLSADWLVECKTTQRTSATIRHSNLWKIREEAALYGHRAALALRFENNGGKDYFVVEDVDFYWLLSCVRELNALQ